MMMSLSLSFNLRMSDENNSKEVDPQNCKYCAIMIQMAYTAQDFAEPIFF